MKLHVPLIAFLLVVISAFLSAGQGRERFIEWGWLGPGSPPSVIHQPDGKTVPTNTVALEIISIIVEGKPVVLGQPFVAGDDWMRTLKVRVKNISGKPIVRAVQHFGLSETRDKYRQGILGVYLRYGRAVGGDTEEEKQPVVMPGEEFELTRTKKIYEQERQWVAEWGGVTDISRVTLDSASVRFDDETVWGGHAEVKDVLAKPH